jgi:hypothetical protein
VIFRGACAVWRTFTPAERAYWAEQARSGQNSWLAFSTYTQRLGREGFLPQAVKTALHVGAPPPPSELTAIAQGHSLVFTWRDAPGAYTTGIFVGITPDFIPAISTLVSCMPTKLGEPRQATVLLAPGTYYVVARSGATDGGIGPAGAVVGPVELK